MKTRGEYGEQLLKTHLSTQHSESLRCWWVASSSTNHRRRCLSRRTAVVPLLSARPADQASRCSCSALVVALVLLAVVPCTRKEGVLDLPHRCLAAHTELQVLLRDRIPVLVHHHDAQEHTEGEKEETIDVVVHGVADRHAEGEQHDLGDNEECSAKENVANGPSVFKRSEDEDELRNDVNDRADEWPQDVNDKQSDRFCEFETRELLEGGDSNEEGYGKHDEA